MLDPAAGSSRAHRLRLLRAGDDPLRAHELQGFRFRAAARPGAACSYAMLVRQWHVVGHQVRVQGNGVLYRGERYRSLSEIARLITGTRWSGPRFFGLKP